MTWPHDFHLWLVEMVAWVTAVLAWSVPRWLPGANAWWTASTPAQRTLALAVLVGGTGSFVCLGFWLTWRHDVASLGWLRAFFYLGAEFSPSSAFAAALFWLTAWFAWRIYRHTGLSTWLMATVLCGYMGADEWFSIHEFIGRSAQSLPLITQSMSAIAEAGFGAYSWQLVFLPVIAGVGITLLLSFRAAVSTTEWWLLIAGGMVFLGGAFGAESRQAHGTRTDPDWWSRPHANLNLLIEEGLEMLGATIVLLVIARHCWRHESARSAASP